MHKPISFTFSVQESHSVPIVHMWNYKGEKIYSFFASSPPTSAAKNLLGYNKFSLKRKAKEFYKEHGILAKNVVKVARGIVYNEVYKQFSEWYNLCRTKGWAPAVHRFEYIHTEELLQQCRKDGIANTIPIVAYYGKSPQELKKLLGESTWKKLCKNTYSRNRLLFMKSNSRVTPVEWADIPSTILKGRIQLPPEVYLWLIRTQGKHLKDIARQDANIEQQASYYLDTRRMCKDAGETFNPNWSKRRMKEEHDRLSRMQQARANQWRASENTAYAKLLQVDFGDLHQGIDTVNFSSGVVATPLVNMQQVQEEGQKMRHCVGSYARMCADGNYLVWHLVKEDTETTLGISVLTDIVKTNQGDSKIKVYRLHQHYGSCNAVVQDQDLVNAADCIVEMLQERNKEKVLELQE